MNTIIKNAYVITMDDNDTIYENGSVVIEKNIITFVGDMKDYKAIIGYDEIDAKGNIIMPGLVNAHTHIPMTIFKGYGEGLPLDRWLTKKIWPAEAKLNDEIVYYSTMLGLIEMAKLGTTSFLDMYFFYDSIAKAVKESGHRAIFSRAVIDVDGGGEDRLKRCLEVYEKYKECGNITAMLSIHGEYTNSRSMIERIAKEAERLNASVHIHVSETEKEHKECKQRNGGLTPIQLLHEVGMTKSHIAAAHCVYVEDDDIEIMAQNGIGVLSCPQSNLKLGSGIAPVKKMIEHGVVVGIGTDGSSSNNNLDMVEETMLFSLLQRGTLKDARAISDMQALKAATAYSAKAVGLGDSVGNISKGKFADIIMIDVDTIDFTPKNDYVSSIINSGNGKNVCMTMVDGNIIYKDNQVTFADEVKIRKKVQEYADEILN